MTNTMPRRFVLAAPPSVHEGIGNALRQAFQLPGRASAAFVEKLIEGLNRM